MSRWALVWVLVLLAILCPEFYALGTGHAVYTASYYVRALRYDAVGRWIVLPLWCWLTVHFVVAPRWVGTRPEWRGYVGIALGLVLAALEAFGVTA